MTRTTSGTTTTRDPLELVNLANDRSRRNQLRELFGRLRSYESEELERI